MIRSVKIVRVVSYSRGRRSPRKELATKVVEAQCKLQMVWRRAHRGKGKIYIRIGAKAQLQNSAKA